MDLETCKQAVMEMFANALIETGQTIGVMVQFTISMSIPETPRSMYGWENHKGGSEVSWDEGWESEIIAEIYKAKQIIKIGNDEYPPVDFEFTNYQFSHEGNGAAVDATVECWIDVADQNKVQEISQEGLGKSLTISSDRIAMSTPILNFKVLDTN